MITQTRAIDPDSPIAKKQFDKIVSEWRRKCVKSVASVKSLRKGGRALRREIERRGCKIEKDESDDQIVMTFLDKGKTKGQLTIILNKHEPEPATP